MKTRFYYQIDYIDENGFANYIDTFCENKLKKAKKHWKYYPLHRLVSVEIPILF